MSQFDPVQVADTAVTSHVDSGSISHEFAGHLWNDSHAEHCSPFAPQAVTVFPG